MAADAEVALYTITRPNATSPSVRNARSFWSAVPRPSREPLDEAAERVAARLEVSNWSKLAQAGLREDDVSRLGALGGGRERVLDVAGALERDIGAAERHAPSPPPPGRRDRRGRRA